MSDGDIAKYRRYNVQENGVLQTLLDVVRPIGSLYWSSKPTDPGTLFGGTWQRIQGRFVWAKGDTDNAAGCCGGEECVTLKQCHMPQHTHCGCICMANAVYSRVDPKLPFLTDASPNEIYVKGCAFVCWSGTSYNWSNSSDQYQYSELCFNSACGSSGGYSSTGGNGAHNNMPPFIAKYCWIRTA